MFICYIFHPRSAIHSGEPAEITGRKWSLRVVRDETAGPYYPHAAEHLTSEGYRLFAGRLAGVPPSDQLPEQHAVSRPDAADWRMEPEPDGSWLAFKFDRNTDIVSIASDLFLLQRWYYTQQDGAWYFSNSLLYLCRQLPKRAEMDPRALPFMLMMGFLPHELTPLQGISGLRGNQSLTVTAGQPRITLRRTLPVWTGHRPAEFGGPNGVIDMDRACTLVLSALREAVARELQHAERVILTLSGGMDSRFLLGCAREVIPNERFSTVTFGHPRSLDFRIGTGLARKLGVPFAALPMDTRPLDVLLSEAFPYREGMYQGYPDYPVAPMRAALPPRTIVLSGYIGDLVFGSYDSDPAAFRTEATDDLLCRTVLEDRRICFVPIREVLPLLSDPAGAERHVRTEFGRAPGRTLQERYLSWVFENFMNRTNFALQVDRDRAFYVAPFVHGGVLTVASALAPALRRNEAALQSALRTGFPDLYSYPLKKCLGFRPDQSARLRRMLLRAWWGALSRLDDHVGTALGKPIFFHPRWNYAHYRDLFHGVHHDFVAGCLDELRNIPYFDGRAMLNLRNRYVRNKRMDRELFRGLLTVWQWHRYNRS
ncbi:hypothetical protein KKH27_10530 [bacterium]|nr:hypothetical protein [bacterium]